MHCTSGIEVVLPKAIEVQEMDVDGQGNENPEDPTMTTYSS